MAALHYMPLFVSDYLADAAHLTTQEHGAYLLLIMTYWQRGEALPADDIRLARIARVTRQEWDGMRDTLAEFFEAGEATWAHAKIEQVLADVRAKSDKARNAGKASAERRNGNRSTDAEQTLNERSTDVQPIKEKKINEGSNEPSTNARAPDAVPDEFATTFWPAYPHKVGKPDAEKKFRAARKVASLEEIMAGLRSYITTKPPDRQWCNPATWLNQQRWADKPAATLPFVQNTARPNGGSNAAFQHILNRRAARDAMPAGGFEILPPIGSGH